MGTPLRVKVEMIHSILTKNKELWKQIKSNLVGNLKLLFYSLYNLQYKNNYDKCCDYKIRIKKAPSSLIRKALCRIYNFKF